MTAAQSLGSGLSSFTLKQEKDDCNSNEDDENEQGKKEDEANGGGDDNDDDDDSSEDSDNEEEEEEEAETYEDDDDGISVSSLAQPSILDKESFEYTKSTDEFLRLTSMVRRVYFSYLHKSIIGNYNVCWQGKNEKRVSKLELKKFASRMELCAVKASLEASLYRRSMLKMISDIKSNTSGKKTYEKLKMFLETPPNVLDVAVQTNEDCTGKQKESSYSDKSVRSNFEGNRTGTAEPTKNLDDRITELLKSEVRSKSIRFETQTLDKTPMMKVKKEKEALSPLIYRGENEQCKIDNISTRLTGNVENERQRQRQRQQRSKAKSPLANHRSSENQLLREILEKDEDDGETMLRGSKDSIVEKETTVVTGQEAEEGSQDSLMRHLEDMFCESDDSSDLMTLIEKHSGVTKANVDSEIGKMCLSDDEESHLLKRQEQKQQQQPPRPRPLSLIAPQRGALKESLEEKNVSITTSGGGGGGGKRKLSFSNYKRMKKRAMGEDETLLPPHEETPEERQDRKIRGIWFVERVHQVAKLESKMMELSMKNYRKHGRICAKFIELFGVPDEEETTMPPESPIRIEEHLTACKERIAPWVVKYLMPYYTKRIIDNRLLFKTVAKHIADMLIIEKTFPEEDCVDAYIKDYFRNKTSIKIESDIYV